MYIKPRLKREISDNWNPKEIEQESNKVENWLLPWTEFLGKEEMQGLFVQIKMKLSSALSDWKPGDSLAKVLLLPWKNILEKKSF